MQSWICPFRCIRVTNFAKKRHNSFGKNEMWYVIAADKGAKLISGFAEEITPKEYKDRVHNGTFAEVLPSNLRL